MHVAEPNRFLEYRLLVVAEQLRARFTRVMAAHDMTPHQFSALWVLSRYPTASAAEVARAIFVSPQAMGGILDALESRHLIERRGTRRRGRPTPVRISDLGRDRLAAAAGTVEELDNQTRGALGPRLVDALSESIAVLQAVTAGSTKNA